MSSGGHTKLIKDIRIAYSRTIKGVNVNLTKKTKKTKKMQNRNIFGNDLFDFKQLKSGKFAGRNVYGIFVSEDVPEKGTRFSHIQFFPANEAEEAEYWG